jgi:hypothetical protein
MHQDLSERIRERAYEIWIASGVVTARQINIGLPPSKKFCPADALQMTEAPAKRIRGRPTVERAGRRPD